MTVTCTWLGYTATAQATWLLGGNPTSSHRGTYTVTLTDDNSIQLKVVRGGKSALSKEFDYYGI